MCTCIHCLGFHSCLPKGLRTQTCSLHGFHPISICIALTPPNFHQSHTQIVFGDDVPAKPKAAPAPVAAAPVAAEATENAPSCLPGKAATNNGATNNYARPAGQNVGNFITDRPSSRVLAAPGGASQAS